MTGDRERLRQAPASRWENRYEGPLDNTSLLMVTLAESGALDLGRPHLGVDGARYQAGVCGEGLRRGTPLVLVRTRAVCELVTGWPDRSAARSWARERAADGGPLTWPACAGESRAVREEQVLAGMLRHPWQAGALAAALRWHTCLSDLRDEIFAVLAVIARRGATISAATAGEEIRHRYASAPRWAQDEAGGPQAPRAAAYLRRLASTEIAPDTALAAASALTRPRQPLLDPGRGPQGRREPSRVLPPPRNGPGPAPGSVPDRTHRM
jgi:hypothetical protein